MATVFKRWWPSVGGALLAVSGHPNTIFGSGFLAMFDNYPLTRKNPYMT
jgi:hypothetical protein